MEAPNNALSVTAKILGGKGIDFPFVICHLLFVIAGAVSCRNDK
jgi:uncharacterized integral membrane protein